MKLWTAHLFIFFSLCLSLTLLPHCGGGGGNGLIITPAGPVIVIIGEGVQFSANQGLVTWSVGGDATNGSISSGGFYNSPAELPADPNVTVRAVAPGGDEATALVTLRTADQVAFDPANTQQISQTPIDPGATTFNNILFGPGDSIYPRVGSQKTVAVWSLNDENDPLNPDDNEAVVFYSQNDDLSGFSPERELSRTPQVMAVIGGSPVLDSLLNPHYLQLTSNGMTQFSLGLVSSSDGGVNFGPAIPVDPDSITDAEVFAGMDIDSEDRLHLTYSRVTVSASPQPAQVMYARSDDLGQSFKLVELSGLSGDPANVFSDVGISEDGQTVAVCWNQVTDITAPPVNRTLKIAVSQDGGESFTNAPDRPLGAISSDLPPLCDIEVAPDGKIYAVYPSGNDVILTRSSDGGSTFDFDITVNQENTNIDAPSARLAIDSQGRLNIVWGVDRDMEGANETEVLSFARSLDMGESFEIVPTLDIGLDNATDVQLNGLRADESGRLFLSVFANEVVPTSYQFYATYAD